MHKNILTHNQFLHKTTNMSIYVGGDQLAAHAWKYTKAYIRSYYLNKNRLKAVATA